MVMHLGLSLHMPFMTPAFPYIPFLPDELQENPQVLDLIPPPL